MSDQGEFTLKIAKPLVVAVAFHDNATMPHPRRYWLAWLVGWFVGPFLMAMFRPKSARFGVIRDGKFKWVEIERR